MNLALLFSLLAAIHLGVSDFLAGLYSRRYSLLSLLFVAEIAGLLMLLAAMPLFSGTTATVSDIIWGAVSGIAGAGGILLLVQGFRVGLLSVVSPVSSLGAAGIPLMVGLLLGEEPTLLASIGLGAGLVAIWLVGSGSADVRSGERSLAAGFWYGIGAGVGFALMLLALAAADAGSGIWPLLSMQVALTAVFAVVLLIRRQPVRIALSALPGIAGIGIAGIVGMLCFLYATRAGLVSIAAVIASMSPAITVLLARLFMGEVLSRQQLAGLFVAAAALVLIGAH